MAAVRHLGFSKIWFLSIWVPNLVQKCRSTPKLWPEIWFMSKGSVATWATDFPYGCQIQCKNVDQRPNYGPKSKFKIAAVRHLGILISSHSLFVGLHQPVEFCANPNYSFEDMGIWIFCRNGLKCLFSPQKNHFFGLDGPVNVISHHRDHQKALLCLKPRVLSI